MRLEIDRSLPQQKVAFDEYLDGLYGYAIVLSRNNTEAEDLVQKTCLCALRAVGRLRNDVSVKSALFTILRNIWLNQLRKRWNTPDLVELERGEQVRSAIQQLPLNFQEIIFLREYEYLSYQEIAAVINCPLGIVMSRLAKARAKLRTLLFGGPAASHLQH